jgi:hypothetical protein
MSASVTRRVDWDATIVARAPDILSRRVEAGVVLLSPSAAEPVVLADSAAMLWDRLASPRVARTVLDELSDRYGVAPDLIAEDVETALRELLERGLIELA